jgi:hypothetical protein
VQRPIPVDSRISGRWGEETSTGIRASGAGILYHFGGKSSYSVIPGNPNKSGEHLHIIPLVTVVTCQ